MKLVIYIFIILVAKISLAQEDSVLITSNPEIMPQFPGGVSELVKFLNKNLKYPQKAKDEAIGGTCYVDFVIDTVGQIKNIKVVKGIKNCTECDDEAKRLISIMPNWSPYIVNGKVKECKMMYPLIFKMK